MTVGMVRSEKQQPRREDCTIRPVSRTAPRDPVVSSLRASSRASRHIPAALGPRTRAWRTGSSSRTSSSTPRTSRASLAPAPSARPAGDPLVRAIASPSPSRHPTSDRFDPPRPRHPRRDEGIKPPPPRNPIVSRSPRPPPRPRPHPKPSQAPAQPGHAAQAGGALEIPHPSVRSGHPPFSSSLLSYAREMRFSRSYPLLPPHPPIVRSHRTASHPPSFHPSRGFTLLAPRPHPKNTHPPLPRGPPPPSQLVQTRESPRPPRRLARPPALPQPSRLAHAPPRRAAPLRRRAGRGRRGGVADGRRPVDEERRNRRVLRQEVSVFGALAVGVAVGRGVGGVGARGGARGARRDR